MWLRCSLWEAVSLLCRREYSETTAPCHCRPNMFAKTALALANKSEMALVTLLANDPSPPGGPRDDFRSYANVRAVDDCAPIVASSLHTRIMAAGMPFVVLTNNRTLKRQLRHSGVDARMLPKAVLAAIAARRASNKEDVTKDAGFWGLAAMMKVAMVGMVEFERVCFADLDVVLRVHPLDWMLKDPRAHAAELIGCGTPHSDADRHSEVLNAGIFCVRPSLSAYRQLLSLVANGSFSFETGWSLRGAPAAPAAPRHGREQLMSWRWASANVEQGLFYYVYHVLRGTFHRPHGCTVREMQARKLAHHFLGMAREV